MATTKQRLQKIWTSPDAFATTLLVLAVDAYGTEIAEWTPETIRREIEEDVEIQLPQHSLDRLMAGIVLVSSNDFFVSLPDFIALCNVLSGDLYDPYQWDPADSSEIAWGITEALLLSPPEEENPFAPEIIAYIAAVLDQEGIIQPPDVLRIAINPAAARYPEDFSDDPALYNAIWQFEQAKTEDINTMVRSRLLLLADQLADLPLQNGKTETVVQRIYARFRDTANAAE